jgi:hypothetical protein
MLNIQTSTFLPKNRGGGQQHSFVPNVDNLGWEASATLSHPGSHAIRYDNVTLIPLVLQLVLRIGPIQRMGAN